MSALQRWLARFFLKMINISKSQENYNTVEDIKPYLFLWYLKGLGFEWKSRWRGKDKDGRKTEIYERLRALRRFFRERLPFC